MKQAPLDRRLRVNGDTFREYVERINAQREIKKPETLQDTVEAYGRPEFLDSFPPMAKSAPRNHEFIKAIDDACDELRNTAASVNTNPERVERLLKVIDELRFHQGRIS